MTPLVTTFLAAIGASWAATPAAGPAPTEARLVVERVVDGEERGRGGIVSWITGKSPDAPFVRPYGVAWDGEDLLVTDPGASRVVRVSPGGKSTRTREGLFESPIGVAVCGSLIVVTDSREGTVTALESSLRPARVLASGLERPTGIACDGRTLFVVETGRHRIVVLDENGSVERTMGERGAESGKLNFPAALALSGTRLWVGDTLNFRVQALGKADGAGALSFGVLGDSPGETPQVKGIAVDGAGRIWLTDGILDAVAIFGPDGTFLAHVGTPGRAPGQFSFPAGIAAHRDGRMAVVDSLNRRVQVVRLELQGAAR